jgi:arylsulfatase A-like enzyme
LPDQINSGRTSAWGIKATGELAQRGVETWLKQCDPERPFFVFLNYMEAHRPYIPPESYRQRMMSPEQVKLSYQVDRSWLPWWAYTFRLHTYSDQQLAITAGTYDAALAELDDLLHNLLTSLRASGHLRNTIVVVTSDHGEHLGEHHMLDHQYSVYEPLVRVPLVIHYPPRFEPGRDLRPVSTIDLFPTLLELAGVDPPADLRSRAVSLLTPREERDRLVEYPAHFSEGFERIQQVYPDWDPSPWQRSLRALFRGDCKYIWSSDGRHELYNIRADARELNNLVDQAELAEPLAAALAEVVAALRQPGEIETPQRTYSETELQVLKSLGYVAGDDDEYEDEEIAASRPASAPAKENP